MKPVSVFGMPLYADDFEFVEVDEFISVNGKPVPSKGIRWLHKITRKNFGEYFQVQVRSMEWRAAGIVFEKYKRKNDLTFEDLVSLRRFAESVVEQRKSIGKSINQDFLVQQVSAELKKRITDKAKPKEDFYGQ